MTVTKLILDTEKSLPKAGKKPSGRSAASAKLNIKEIWAKFRPLAFKIQIIVGMFSEKIAQAVQDFMDGMDAAIK